MLFKITHTTRYRYGQPVRLGPQVIRLRPRADGSHRLLEFGLRIEPEPSAVTECLDLEGNVVTHAWFAGPTERLHIRASFTVETLRGNPFDYLPPAEFGRLPAVYPDDLADRLAAYRAGLAVTPLVREFAATLAGSAAPSRWLSWSL